MKSEIFCCVTLTQNAINTFGIQIGNNKEENIMVFSCVVPYSIWFCDGAIFVFSQPP